MNPVIPEDILLVLALVVIGGPVAWLAGRWAWRWLFAGALKARERLMKAARTRTRRTVEDDSGDAGGMPAGAGDTTSTWRPNLHFPTNRRDQRRAGDMTHRD